MKNLRILGVILGTFLLTAMYSCGGSSYLTEAPLELWDSDSVVVHFQATGMDDTSPTSGQTGLSKAFFSDGDFSGGGTFDGESQWLYAAVDCQFDAPTAGAIDGGQPGPAAVTFADTDPVLCPDPRNCCVYTIDGDWADPCSLTVDCIVDPLLTDLANTQLNLLYHVKQEMQTNMYDDSGVFMTSIVEEGTSGGVPDSDIFDLTSGAINRADCIDAAGKFVANDDNIWLNNPGQNAPDLLNNLNLIWNVDSIGAVNVSGSYADCIVYYENIAGSVSLAPVAIDQPVAKESLLDGFGRICNSQSYTDCGGAPSFGLTLDMYDPATAGDDLTFAQAGVHHICGDTEGDDCHPTAGAGNSSCMPYLINNVEPAYDGCLNLCFDYTGIGPPSVGGSPWADYVLNLSLDSDQATCEANNGTWVEMEPGMWMCMPNQLMACVVPEPEIYTRDDTYVASVDEPDAGNLAAILDNATNASNRGAADMATTEKSMRDKYTDCLITYGAGTALAAIPYERNTSGMNSDPSVDDTCHNVASRFIDTVATPFAVGDLGTDKALTPYNVSVEFVSSGTSAQGLIIRILDGGCGGLGTPVFEDISGAYVSCDATKIPAEDTVEYPVGNTWFSVDQRVTAQTNPLLPAGLGEGDWMSVYTDDGLTKGGESWIKVSTHLDFHRIKEANLFDPVPENVYLLIIDLMAPISAAGGNAGMGCDFEQQFVIDGTCIEELP